MPLHLVVPGLLWPAESLREATRDLNLPALSALLGRGQCRLAAPRGLCDWIAQAFSIPAGEAPWGALRRLGEADFSQADGVWLCADPVHLRFARDTLVLADARELAIGAGEARALAQTLADHFADLGRFDAAAPDRWYLRLAAPPSLSTQPLERVVGRSVERFLPEGPDARRWRALLNEAQMLMHAHPVNAEREARGHPAINSLWLWGAGGIPKLPAPPFAAAFADEPLVIGAARAGRVACRPLPVRAPLEQGEGALAVVDALRGPAAARDLPAWRGALAQLEQDWFAPLLAALHAGGLRALTLTAPGDEATLELTLGTADRWKLWRRPQPLSDLASAIAVLPR